MLSSPLSVDFLLLIIVKVVHLILSWSAFLSWTLLAVDLILIGFLSMRAYRDGKSRPSRSLDSYHVYPLRTNDS